MFGLLGSLKQIDRIQCLHLWFWLNVSKSRAPGWPESATLDLRAVSLSPTLGTEMPVRRPKNLERLIHPCVSRDIKTLPFIQRRDPVLLRCALRGRPRGAGLIFDGQTFKSFFKGKGNLEKRAY